MTNQLSWPLELVASSDGTTSYAEVPTDSDAEVLRAAALIADTRPDQLEWSPETGVPTGLASTDGPEFAEFLESALRTQEPRLPDGFHVRAAESDDADDRELYLVAGVTSIPVTL